jgi:hydrogenase maturation protein HypF
MALIIKVKGVVQGVGFRPFVHTLASEMGLKGFVSNTSSGVSIEVEGEGADLFVERLRAEAPPLARIAEVDVESAEPKGYEDFRILGSTDSGSFTLVSPDTATCPDCMAELLNPSDRRFSYPFINCTNCGPRYTITERVPYDRPNTTMRAFTMCGDCMAEYEDPSDRRFHAVPNACARCGPGVSLLNPDGSPAQTEDPVKEAVRMILKGDIVALKGLGGFHLACDAENQRAVEKLRKRKRRANKPFALMAEDIDLIRRHCFISEAEEHALRSAARPVVLLEKRPGSTLPGGLAPGNRHLGFMLPYTPLHALIFREAPGAIMVMTSGNISEEPIQVENQGALKKLGGVADAFLVHDRDIFMRVDDSVIMVHGTGEGVSNGFIRRSRGYAPEPLRLMDDGPDVLAVGADLKNTFAVAKGPYAIVSQHIGDMEGLDTLGFFEETLDNLCSVYRVEPVAVAHDLHPGYASTHWAIEKRAGLRLLGFQHHWAHVASVMAEKGLRGKVIGVAMDGTGYGPDGTLWGGEFLVADLQGYKRAGHLSYVPLPGGEKAIKEPWRTAASLVASAYGEQEAPGVLGELGFFDRYGEDTVRAVVRLAGMREFSPLSSGAGRVFDAVSALLGICGHNSFEGEAAIALEAEADDNEAADYPVNVAFREPMEVDFTYTLVCIINDVRLGVPPATIAAKFHNTMVAAADAVVRKLSVINDVSAVALSGGVFQNRRLLNGLRSRLMESGFSVFTNEVVPANDGGISLGQAYLLRERLRLEGKR